jgi:DNA-binding transcriptional LysR family regulator
VVQRAVRDKLIERENGNLVLTEHGRQLANEAIMR